MKKIALFLLSVILVPLSEIFPQNNTFKSLNWDNPVLLTDTTSYNTKPSVMFPSFDETFMFYEKKFSMNGPKRIFFRDIKNFTPEQPLVEDTLYDYYNPVSVNGAWLILSNLNGNTDIYSVNIEGSSVTLNQLTFSDNDESSLFAYSDRVCWISDSAVYTAILQYSSGNYFLDMITEIDNNGCNDPVCNYDITVYTKLINGHNIIHYCTKDPGSTGWNLPVSLECEGDNLTVTNSDYGMGTYNIFWENNNTIYTYDFFEITTFTPSGPLINNICHPSPLYWSISTDAFTGFFAFAGNTDGNQDIFSYFIFGNASDPENISFNSRYNAFPHYYKGWYESGGVYLFCIWETYFQDKVALMMTKTYCLLWGYTDFSKTENSLKMMFYADPSSYCFTGKYYQESNEPMLLRIITQMGEVKYSYTDYKPLKGWNELKLPDQQLIPPCIYILQIIQGNQSITKKLPVGR